MRGAVLNRLQLRLIRGLGVRGDRLLYCQIVVPKGLVVVCTIGHGLCFGQRRGGHVVSVAGFY